MTDAPGRRDAARLSSQPFDRDAVVVGDDVVLRPATPEDAVALHRLAIAQSVLVRWRLRDMLVDVGTYAERSLGGADLNTVVEARDDGSVLALGQCGGTDLAHGHAWLSVIAEFSRAETDAASEGMRRLVERAFATLPIHKLCVEVVDEAVSSAPMPALLAEFTREATLRSHVFVDGQRRDLAIYGITRDEVVGT